MKANRFRKSVVKNPETSTTYTLKDELFSEQGGTCWTYTVQESSTLIVKLMNLSEELIYQQFQQEILAWSRMREEKPTIAFKQIKEGRYDQFANIVQVHGAFRAILKDVEMGVILCEYCPKGSLEQITKRLPAFALKEIQIMRIMRDVLLGVQYMHCRPNPLIHRNLTMANVMLGEDSCYKITNFSNVTTHRYFSIQSDEISSLELEIKNHTTEGYRAPEQIHLYSGQPINEKVDIFAVGVILYILCFNRKPFESMITTLNAEVEIPDFPKYSNSMNQILQRMLTRESQNRPSSSEALAFVLVTWPDLKITQSKTGLLDMDIFNKPAGSEKEVKPTMINKLKKIMTLKVQNKRTKGWILASLEEDEQGPKQKYMRLLIMKAWQNGEKIEKFYDYFLGFLNGVNIQSTIIVLKSLILLHNYMKKGPPEAMSSVGKKVSAVNVLKRIIETWQNVDPTDVSKDKKRSVFTTKLVNQYAQRLKEKMNICVSFSSLIEGNFSLKPFFDNMNKNFKPLTPKLIEDLLKYMSSLVAFAQEILSQNVLIDIQVALMIQLVDEMYCLLSAQTHLLVAFIMSTNYVSKNIDRMKLMQKTKDFKTLFAKNFEAVRQFFRKCQSTLAASNASKDFIPNLDLKVLEYLEYVPIMQDLQNEFNLFEFLNYKKSIFGIKIPLSYGATVQANQRSLLAEMDAIPKKPPTAQKLILQLDDQMTTSNSNSNSQDTKEKNYDFQNQFKRQQELQKHSNQQQMQQQQTAKAKGKQTDANLLSDEEVEDTHLDGLLQFPGTATTTAGTSATAAANKNRMTNNNNILGNPNPATTVNLLNLQSSDPINSSNVGNQTRGMQLQQQQQQKKFVGKGDYLMDIGEDLEDNDDANEDELGQQRGIKKERRVQQNNVPSYQLSQQQQQQQHQQQHSQQQQQQQQQQGQQKMKLILGDFSESDEESITTVNQNNVNYNDILDQDEEGENLHFDFAHQSLNDNVYSHGGGGVSQELQAENQSSAAGGLPSNLDKFKNMNFVDFNDISNIQQQNNNNNNYLNPPAQSPAWKNNQQMNSFQSAQQQQQQNQSNSFSFPAPNNNNNANNFDVFKDFENFENFGLANSKPKATSGNGGSGAINNGSGVHMNGHHHHSMSQPQNSHFDDFNFQFDQKSNSMQQQGNRQNSAAHAYTGFSPQANAGQSTQQQSLNNSNNKAGGAAGYNKSNGGPSQFAQGVSENQPVKTGNNFDFNFNPVSSARHKQNSSGSLSFGSQSNAAGNAIAAQTSKPLLKFEFKESKNPQPLPSTNPWDNGNSSQNLLSFPQPQQKQNVNSGSNVQQQQQQQQQVGGYSQRTMQNNQQNYQNPGGVSAAGRGAAAATAPAGTGVNTAASAAAAQSTPNNISYLFDDFFKPQQPNQLTQSQLQQQQILNNNNNAQFGMQQQQSQQSSRLPPTVPQQYRQVNPNGHGQQGNLFTQKQRQHNAEEFEPNDMIENNKAISFQNPGSIKPNDLNQLNQMPPQNSIHNPRNQAMGSVNSTYSSNNENLIELKNFIINKVKHDPKELILEFESLVFGKKIGSGHSGKVFSGSYNNVEVAIKEMEVNTLNVRNQKEFQREIETLVKLSPQINLVSLIGVSQKKDNFYVVTELCNGGTVFDLLHRRKDVSIPWLHRIKMCSDIARGMVILHSLEAPIIHRDLKSLNLLLDVPYSEDSYDYNIKIADFGLARTESKEEMTQVLGTFHWMAPEVFDNKQYTIKADVYSYAIVLYEFITRKTPYQKMSTVDIMRNVCDGKRPNISSEFIPSDCPPQLMDLMKECWSQESNLRPDFKTILERLHNLEAGLNGSSWQNVANNRRDYQMHQSPWGNSSYGFNVNNNNNNNNNNNYAYNMNNGTGNVGGPGVSHTPLQQQQQFTQPTNPQQQYQYQNPSNHFSRQR